MDGPVLLRGSMIPKSGALRRAELRDEGGRRKIALAKYDFCLHLFGPANNTETNDFKIAWRHEMLQFRKRGAINVLLVFTPSNAYVGSERFFPGQGWADWVGTGKLKFRNSVRWPKWRSRVELLGPLYPRLMSLGGFP